MRSGMLNVTTFLVFKIRPSVQLVTGFNIGLFTARLWHLKSLNESLRPNRRKHLRIVPLERQIPFGPRQDCIRQSEANFGPLLC